MAKDETLEVLQARIKDDMRRAQEMVRAAAKTQYASAKNLLANYAEHWTDTQRDMLARFLGTPTAKTTKATKATKSTRTGQPAKAASARKGVKVPPKYQLPSGETWAGRGKMKAAFVAYAKQHGIDMDKRTKGGKDFPLFNAGAAKTTKPVAAPKATRTPAARKSTKKAAKKVARKTAGKKSA